MAARAGHPAAQPSQARSAARERFQWDSADGHRRLLDIVLPRVNYVPDDSQIELACSLLAGTSVLLIKPTGGGKTTLISYPAMAEPDTITLVCSPLNLLEENMVGSLARQTVSAIAINSDSLSEARHVGRDLVSEAREGRYQVILMSPEMFLSSLFTSLAEDRPFRQRLRRFIVDECHIILLWKTLRPKYSFLGDMRSLLPEHVSFAAMTATLPLGDPTALVLRTLGFRKPGYIIDRHDCQRYDIDLYFRTLSHGIGARTVLDFPDLDWLIPSGMTSAADVPKTLVYCDNIELGYRVSVYLRTLLHPDLKSDENRVITLVHGLSCPHCKADALATLLQSGSERQCAVHVATDVLAMGIDVSDVERVICFGTPESLAAMLQHIGRAARDRDRRGSAYVYVHQADMKRAHAEADRLLYDDVPKPRARGKKPTVPAPQAEAPPSNTSCPALDSVLLAAASNTCVNLPINIAMGNKNVASDYTCGACSSCLGDTLPEPRARASDPAPDTADDVAQPVTRTFVLADVAQAVQALDDIAFVIWSRTSTVEDVSSSVFLSTKWATLLVTTLDALTSVEAIKTALSGWRYLDIHGDELAREILQNRSDWMATIAAAKAERLKKTKASATAKKRRVDREDEQLFVRRAKEQEARDAAREALADISNSARASQRTASGAGAGGSKRRERAGESDEEWTPGNKDGGERRPRKRARIASASDATNASSDGAKRRSTRHAIVADQRQVIDGGESRVGRKRVAIVYDRENL